MNKWTNEEIEFLINNYANKTAKELRGVLHHPIKSIQKKAAQLELRKKSPNAKWTAQEIDILKDNYKTKTCKIIGLMLGKNDAQVLRKLKNLGLKKDKYIPQSTWTNEEVEILKSNYSTKMAYEIAPTVGKSLWAVQKKAKKLGLKKGKKRSERTKKQISNKLLGIKKNISAETRKRMGELSRKRLAERKHPPCFGKTWKVDPEKNKKRFGEIGRHTGHKHGEESKKRMSKSIKNGDPIKLKERCRKGAIACHKALAKRNGPTSIEKIVINYLESINIKYLWEEIIDKFIVDLYIPSVNLVIECDGQYWHSKPERIAYDQYKTNSLINLGMDVIRLPEKTIENGEFVNLIKEKLCVN